MNLHIFTLHAGCQTFSVIVHQSETERAQSERKEILLEIRALFAMRSDQPHNAANSELAETIVREVLNRRGYRMEIERHFDTEEKVIDWHLF